jgi:hypothetical protein
MHIHPAREEAEVIEALTNAFNPRDLVVTGVPSHLRQGDGLLADTGGLVLTVRLATRRELLAVVASVDDGRLTVARSSPVPAR